MAQQQPDIPPALAALLNMSTAMTPVSAPNSGIAGSRVNQLPSYATGGMVGGNGMPVRPNYPGNPGLNATAGGQEGSMGPQQMEMEARQFVQQNPQQVAEIRQGLEEALADGDITMDQVTILSQMARVALQNPSMYPQLRQAIIQQGIVEEDDLSPTYDQGMLFVFLLIGQIMQGAAPSIAPAAAGGVGANTIPGGSPPAGLSVNGLPSMSQGGALPQRSQRKDGKIPIAAHEGEYVIPRKVVLKKGTDFFDKLIAQAEEQESGQA